MTILCSAPSLLGGSDSGAVARRRQRWLTPRKLTPGRPRHDAVGARGRLSTHQREGAERFANDLDCGRRVVLSRAASTLRSVETHRRADGSSSGARKTRHAPVLGRTTSSFVFFPQSSPRVQIGARAREALSRRRRRAAECRRVSGWQIASVAVAKRRGGRRRQRQRAAESGAERPSVAG